MPPRCAAVMPPSCHHHARLFTPPRYPSPLTQNDRESRRSCDHCRHKKIKCGRTLPACLQCLTYNIQCTYGEGRKDFEALQSSTTPTGAASAGTAGGAASDSALLGKLNRLEFLMEKIICEPDEDYSSVNTNSFRATLIEDQYGQGHLIGEPSVMAVSLQTQQFLPEEHSTGENGETPKTVIQGFFAGIKTSCPLEHIRPLLPAKEDAHRYVDQFFSTTCWPLMDKEELLVAMEELYDENTAHVSREKICAFLLVMGFGFDGISRLQGRTATWSTKIYNAAFSLLSNTTTLPSNRMCIAALLLMSFQFQSSGNFTQSYSLMGNATRMAQGIGLHLDVGDTPHRLEINRCLFWCVYQQDTYQSVAMGRPPCLDDSDCMTELPYQRVYSDSVVFFRCGIRLSRCLKKIYKNLYGVAGARKSAIQKRTFIAQMQQELDQVWYEVPSRYRPPTLAEKQNLDNLRSKGNINAGAELHSLYYNCLCMIYSEGVGFGSIPSANNAAGSPSSASDVNSSSNYDKCLDAARKYLSLMGYLTSGISSMAESLSTLFLMIAYPMVPYFVIFMHLRAFPSESTAGSDMQLLETIDSFVKSLKDVSDGARRLYSLIHQCVVAARHYTASVKEQVTTDRFSQIMPITPYMSGYPMGVGGWEEGDAASDYLFKRDQMGTASFASTFGFNS